MAGISGMNESLTKATKKVHEIFIQDTNTLAIAESCTGGLLGGAITAQPGSSEFFLGGVIAYSNRIKRSMLGVDSDVLVRQGAVSQPVAKQMAEGVRHHFAADFTLSVTGIAGPGGGTAGKPVGLVYLGYSGPSRTEAVREQFDGTRKAVRQNTIERALNLILDCFPRDS